MGRGFIGAVGVGKIEEVGGGLAVWGARTVGLGREEKQGEEFAVRCTGAVGLGNAGEVGEDKVLCGLGEGVGESGWAMGIDSVTGPGKIGELSDKGMGPNNEGRVFCEGEAVEEVGRGNGLGLDEGAGPNTEGN